MTLFRKFGLVYHFSLTYLSGDVNLSVTAESWGKHTLQTLVIFMDVDVTGKDDSILAYENIESASGLLRQRGRTVRSLSEMLSWCR